MARPPGIPSKNKGKAVEEIYGVERAKEIRHKCSNSRKGKAPWNKGLTVETDARVAQNSQNSPRNKGKHHTQKWKENMSETMQKRPITWGAKISEAKTGIAFSDEHRSQLKEAKKLNIHDQLVLQHLADFEKDGYRCIPILRGSPLPDIVAIKDSKVYAIEIERVRTKPQKYAGVHCYDDIIWIVLPWQRKGSKNG